MATPAFDPAAISIWSLPLRDASQAAPAFERYLSADELARATGYGTPRLRATFTLCRAALRLLLGRFLGMPAESLRFQYGEGGKPGLSAPAPAYFSVAHCGSMALIGISEQVEIGVDIEMLRPTPELEDIARCFFCAGETGQLLELRAAERTRAFFHCWTRKEAYLKATGEGLLTALDSFRVSLDADAASFLHLPDGAGPWTLRNLELGDRYAAALAHRGEPRPFQVHEFATLYELLQETGTGRGRTPLKSARPWLRPRLETRRVRETISGSPEF